MFVSAVIGIKIVASFRKSEVIMCHATLLKVNVVKERVAFLAAFEVAIGCQKCGYVGVLKLQKWQFKS